MPSRKNRPAPPFKDIYTKTPLPSNKHEDTNSRLKSQSTNKDYPFNREQNSNDVPNKVDPKSFRYAPTTGSKSKIHASKPHAISTRKSNGETTAGPEKTKLKIKILQRELDEVKFFREIEEAGISSKKKMQDPPMTTYPLHQNSDSSLEDKFYEYMLQIKTLDLKLKSVQSDNLQLKKKLEIEKNHSKEQQKESQNEIKTLGKQFRSFKKDISTMEEKNRDLEMSLENQQKQAKHHLLKLEDKLKKKDEKIDLLEKDVLKQKKHNKALDKQINSCIETIEIAEKQLASSSKEARDLSTIRNSLEEQLIKSKNELLEKEKNVKMLRQEMIGYKKKSEDTTTTLHQDMTIMKEKLLEKERELVRKESDLADSMKDAEENEQTVRQELEKSKRNLILEETKTTRLVLELKEKDTNLSTLTKELEDVKSKLTMKENILTAKNTILNDQKMLYTNLEERFTSTKEIMENNECTLEMQRSEINDLKAKNSEIESKLESETERSKELKARVTELSNELKVANELNSTQQNMLDSLRASKDEMIQEHNKKIQSLEDQLEKSNNTKEEVLLLQRTKWKRTEDDLRQQLMDKENSISKLEKELLHEKEEMDINKKKYEKQVLETQEKLNDATQKLIDTMSKSLASGEELEQYRAKILDSEVENGEKVRNLEKSLKEKMNELDAKEKMMAQYKEVTEKLCLELEETKTDYDAEIEEMELDMENLKSEIEMKYVKIVDEMKLEMEEMEETGKKYQREIEQLKKSSNNLRGESLSMESIYHLLESKFSRIVSLKKNTDSVSISSKNHNVPASDRIIELSDSLFDIIQEKEQDLRVFFCKIREKEEEINELRQLYEDEISILKEKVLELNSNYSAAQRRSASTNELKEKEFEKTLLDEREKLKRAKSEIEILKTLAKNKKEKYYSMKMQSEHHISVLQTALEDSKSDIKHLETMVHGQRHNREKFFSEGDDRSTIIQQFQSEKISRLDDELSTQGTIRSYESNNDRMIRDSFSFGSKRSVSSDHSNHGRKKYSENHKSKVHENENKYEMNEFGKFMDSRSRLHNEI